jgi:hypothetical protein
MGDPKKNMFNNFVHQPEKTKTRYSLPANLEKHLKRG